MRELAFPNHCANLDCHNRPGEGKFSLLESSDKVIGGYRYMRLWLCSPCAAVLQEMLKES